MRGSIDQVSISSHMILFHALFKYDYVLMIPKWNWTLYILKTTLKNSNSLKVLQWPPQFSAFMKHWEARTLKQHLKKTKEHDIYVLHNFGYGCEGKEKENIEIEYTYYVMLIP
ncbi:hypothetical protein V6N13_120886 [Hibiscus sabdariffa]